MRAFAMAAVLASGGCAPVPTTSAMSIPLEILRPPGAGPFPAVVVLHDCSGLGPRSSGAPRRWAKLLQERGYVVAIPDSFSTRGFPDGVCTEPNRGAVGPFRRVRDAYETLDHLRALPYVDGARIGVMGGSHGGTTTVASVAATLPFVAQRTGAGFAAAVALYPGCAIGEPRFTTRYRATAPLLILSGELDDWTPAQPCRELAAVADASGPPVKIVVYPGAHHSFDSAAPLRYNPARVNGNAPGGRGATTAGNAQAWADSIREATAFFGQALQVR